MSTRTRLSQPLAHRLCAGATLALAACAVNLAPVLLVPQGALAQAQAQATAPEVAASAQFTLKGVRPEAWSWLWDNQDEALLKAANSEVLSFKWATAPATPQHLGYSEGASHVSEANVGGAAHTFSVTYLAPEAVKARVPSDNFLGSKPYSFVAQQVSVDGDEPFTVLVQYKATGSTFTDTELSIELTGTDNTALAQAYVAHLRKTFTGLQAPVMDALNERYFNAVLKKRGFYAVGPSDKQLNAKLAVNQEIIGITPDMLRWWWDHIGNTERYKLWQPIDHLVFEWTIAPVSPDMSYDVGAVQRVKEKVGKTAYTLNITGADPAVKAPPVAINDPAFFYARTNLSALAKIVPDGAVVHQWKANATGDGVVLQTTFLNTTLARILQKSFFEDLGSHCLREFQMLPYFLPRLYKREQLGQ
jgi:hypothetical protein